MGKKYLFLIAGSLLFVCYQNFGQLTLDELNTIDRLQELRGLSSASDTPQLAKPQGGKDLESVSGDWLQRQGSIWLDGRDQRWVESMNQRLNNWLATHKTAAGAAPPHSNSANLKTDDRDDGGEFRFTRINEMEYRWTKDSVLTCSLQGDGAHLDYSKKLSSNTHLGFDHWTGKSQTQVHLKYNW
ncbi:MAG: hypothetical protein ACKOX6_13495 [Bdellovibrio sp.]